MTLPPPSPPVLDYQRLERARKTAIGGLRLLGILLAVVSMVAFFIALALAAASHVAASRASTAFIIFCVILAFIFLLGLAKFLCAVFMARRSRGAARIAFAIMSLETLLLAYAFYHAIIYAYSDSYDSFAYHCIVPSLAFLILLGWIAVDFEILQVIRREKSASLA